MCNVIQANISVGYKTVHSLITIKLALHSNQRGPGPWKLYSSFLSDMNYVNQIQTSIQEVLAEYENDDGCQTRIVVGSDRIKSP